MILLFHIITAFVSLAWSTWLYFAPSKGRLYTAYSLVTATLVSGSYLIATQGSHILETCTTGLVYLGIVSVAIYSARNKLAAAHS